MRQRLWRHASVPALLVAALPLMALTSVVAYGFDDDHPRPSPARGSAPVTPGKAPAASASIAISPVDRPGAVVTLLNGINDEGVIVGTSATQAQEDAEIEEGFTLKGSSFKTIFFPGATDTNGGGINNKGVVFGTYDIRDAPDPADDGDRCFTWSKGKGYKTVDLPAVTTTPNFDCNGINDSGAVVGSYFDDNNFVNHGFLLTGKKKFVQLDATFAGTFFTEATDINNKGDIVGVFTRGNVNDSNDGAFLLHEGRYTEIKVPGSTSVDAYGINDKGDIVGSYTDTNFVDHGFLLHEGKLTTVDAPFTNAETNKVTGINNKGVMVGVYTDTSDDTEHGFRAKR